MPPSSRTTMRFDCARANFSTAGAPSVPNAAAACRTRRREGWEVESSFMGAPGKAASLRGGRGRQEPSGVEKILRVEQVLDALHHLHLDSRLEERHLLREHLPDAVLRAEGAAQRLRDFVHRMLHAMRDLVGVGA